jgi:hypothetical protein
MVHVKSKLVTYPNVRYCYTFVFAFSIDVKTKSQIPTNAIFER